MHKQYAFLDYYRPRLLMLTSSRHAILGGSVLELHVEEIHMLPI